MSIRHKWAKQAFLAALPAVRGGVLRIAYDGADHRFGSTAIATPGRRPLDVRLDVHDGRFFWRALLGSDIGMGESFMDGDWSSPDLVALIRLMLRNMSVVEQHNGPWSLLHRAAATIARRFRDNSIAGSRRHIHEHYDLGNEFFRLFLDERLMYSCAFYETGRETLGQAQERKLDQICRKLDLGPDDHLLEIGTGWGGFAVWAATRYGCRVTTTTISEEQYRHAEAWIRQIGEPGSRIDVRLEDYRRLTERFDKIVSIEMFEAVGLNHYDDYFGAVDRLLAPDGVMLLQTITVDDQYFPLYHRTPDWIEKYIFPGGELAAVGEILKSLARTTRLSLYHAENIGTHYALTVRDWRRRFHERLEDVRALGFSERFIRMWDLYLAYSEAAFLERHAGDFQLLLTRNASPRRLFNEPAPREWPDQRRVPTAPLPGGDAPRGDRHRPPVSSPVAVGPG